MKSTNAKINSVHITITHDKEFEALFVQLKVIIIITYISVLSSIYKHYY